MPNPHPQATARLDDALECANQLRHRADTCRRAGLLDLAAKIDSRADEIMSAMKDEDHG